jgi:saccharopine dehydrogenase-like NADP-dependent oxidoreductase
MAALPVRRVIVVGSGFFGGLVADRLRALGVAPLVATRRGAELRLDAENESSLRATLRAGDVVVDTAGPFADRTLWLVRVAIDVGADVIDLAESLAWSEGVLALSDRAAAAGVRLYPACSAVAAVAGACVRASGITSPESVDLFLAPASARTASPATVSGFIRSIGRPVLTFRDGGLVTVPGFRDARRFPASSRTGGLTEGASAVLLPRAWPSLRRAEFWVDPNTPFGREALTIAARIAPLAALVRGVAPRVGSAGLGRTDGEFAVAVAAGARSASFTMRASTGSYRIAVEPAAMVAEMLARGASPEPGVVLSNAQVDPDALFKRLRDVGTAIIRA